jgi:hypothetical protein
MIHIIELGLAWLGLAWLGLNYIKVTFSEIADELPDRVYKKEQNFHFWTSFLAVSVDYFRINSPSGLA